MKSRLIKYSITLLLFIFVTGCVAAVPQSQPASMAGDAEADSAFPVTIDHKYGSTTLTAQPERIVTVGLTDHDALLALGIVPVGTTEWFGGYPGSIWPWGQDELEALGGELPEAVGGEGINFEKIATLKPDLILALFSGVTEDEYDLLAQIAPTIAQPGEYVDWGIPWDELTLTVGQAVGQVDEAQALIDEVEGHFAEVRASYPQFAGASSVVATPYQGIWLYGPQDLRGRLLTDLGFNLPEGIEEVVGESFGGNVSQERADMLDLDVIIWLTSAEEAVEAGGAVYESLSVHTESREVFLSNDDPLGGATSFNSVLSLPYLLDGLVPQLAKAMGAEAVEDTSAFPTSIEHKFGTTEIEAEPVRVVSLGYSEQDAILALGVTPIAVRDWFGDQPFGVWPWAQDLLDGAEPTLLQMPYGELNFEQLAALQPDIFIATHSGITEEEYNILSEIAPVLAQSGEVDDFGMSWQEQTMSIGKALGREVRAEALIADVEAKIANAADAAFNDATIAWITPAEGGEFWAVGDHTPPFRFFASLGLGSSPEIAEEIGELSSLKISSERLDMVDTTILVVRASNEDALEEIRSNEIYAQLDVVKDNRVIYFVGNDPVYGALSFSTVLSLPYIVDELVPRFNEIVE